MTKDKVTKHLLNSEPDMRVALSARFRPGRRQAHPSLALGKVTNDCFSIPGINFFKPYSLYY
jgi:hypothetical protein